MPTQILTCSTAIAAARRKPHMADLSPIFQGSAAALPAADAEWREGVVSAARLKHIRPQDFVSGTGAGPRAPEVPMRFA